MMTEAVIIDGSNVSQCSTWKRYLKASSENKSTLRHRKFELNIDDLKTGLLYMVASWAAICDKETTLVFDGEGPLGEGEVVWGEISVVGSGSKDGDETICQLIKKLHDTGRNIWLVSSDRALQLAVSSGVMRTVYADDFVDQITTVCDSLSQAANDKNETRISHGSRDNVSRIADNLHDATRNKLERMRRGILPDQR